MSILYRFPVTAICQNSPILITHLHLAPTLGVTPFKFRRHLCVKKLESLHYYVWRCLFDPAFSRFDTIPAYDGHIDRHTENDGIHRASIASRGNYTRVFLALSYLRQHQCQSKQNIKKNNRLQTITSPLQCHWEKAASPPLTAENGLACCVCC